MRRVAAAPKPTIEHKDDAAVHVLLPNSQQCAARPSQNQEGAVIECAVGVPARYRRKIMGNKGCIMTCLRENHQVQLCYDIHSGTMGIRGAAESVKRCRNEVTWMLDSWCWWDSLGQQ